MKLNLGLFTRKILKYHHLEKSFKYCSTEGKSVEKKETIFLKGLVKMLMKSLYGEKIEKMLRMKVVVNENTGFLQSTLNEF